MIADRNTTLDDDICVHIFTLSGAMMGVCLTVGGILRGLSNVRQNDAIAQSMLGINSTLYLMACLIAYWALRKRGAKRIHQIMQRFADGLFLFGLTLTTLTTVFMTFIMAMSFIP